MARRGSSSPHPLKIVLTIAVFALLAGGGFMAYSRLSDPFRTISALPVRDYMENANSLRGNVYKLDAKVGQALEYSAQSGRLFAVESSDSGEMVAVLIPAELQHINIERGQRFLFKLTVGEKGILRVQEARKT